MVQTSESLRNRVCTWWQFRLESELVAEDRPDVRLSEGGLLRGSVARTNDEDDLRLGTEPDAPVADRGMAVHLTDGQVKLGPKN